MVGHIKPVIQDKPDHIIFNVGTNDIPLDKDARNIVKSIVDLAMSAKFPACDISIIARLLPEKNHKQNVQEVNNHLKEMCTNKSIISLIDHRTQFPEQIN